MDTPSKIYQLPVFNFVYKKMYLRILNDLKSKKFIFIALARAGAAAIKMVYLQYRRTSEIFTLLFYRMSLANTHHEETNCLSMHPLTKQA